MWYWHLGNKYLEFHLSQLHSILSKYAQTTRLHMQALALVAYIVRHASTGTPIGCDTYFLTAFSHTSHASTWKWLQYQFQPGSVSACFKYQSSYLNILQASLLHSCLHDKAKYALTQVQACSLYILYHSRVIILLEYHLKTLTGPSHFSVVMVADINSNEVTKKHAVPLSKVSNWD